jgi:hypothetical protein
MAPTLPTPAPVRRGHLLEFCAAVSWSDRGNNPTPVGVIPARSPRVAWATSGSADIAIPTPNASAKAPARPMYLANPNALVSCHV